MSQLTKKWIAVAAAVLLAQGCQQDAQVAKSIGDQIQSDQSSSDPSGLGKIFLEDVISVGKGTAMQIDMDAHILVMGVLSNDVNDLTSGRSNESFNGASIIEIENGEVSWNEKPLPAAVVKVELSKINRDAGNYEKFCVSFCAVRDEEFARIRDPLYSYCETEKIDEWKNRTGFRIKRLTH